MFYLVYQQQNQEDFENWLERESKFVYLINKAEINFLIGRKMV